jgi:hypothetical protein
MFFAALAAAVMDLGRQGSEVLDCFGSVLRDSKYTLEAGNSSVEHGTDMAKRLRHTTVMLGDVSPEGRCGRVAIAVPGRKQHIGQLRKVREYL